MNILLITSRLGEQSGWERYSSDLAHSLLGSGAHIEVVCQEKNTVFNNIPQTALLPNPLQSKKNYILAPWYALRIARQYRQSGITVVHCLVEPYAFIATLAGFFLRVPYIVTIHGSFGIKPFAHSLYGKIHKYGFSRARCVVAISNYSKRRISEYMQLRNVRVIPNGVNIAKFLDNDGHTTIKDPVLIGVGDVKHRKGYHLVVEALKDVKKIFPGAHYHIVGDQSDKKYVDHLHGKIKKYGLEENVSFHQHISDEELKDLYHKSRIFILTPISGKYDFEGFGLVYLEANASGLPVVGTHNSGGEDAINDGYNGFLTDPEDTTSIAQKIVTLLENDRLCDRMSQNGRIHARNLSWGNVVKQYLEVYNDALK